MEKERFVFDVAFINFVPAQYEVKSKLKHGRLIEALIKKFDKRFTVVRTSTLPYVLPYYITIEQFETLLSFYYQENEDFIKVNPDFTEEEKTELRESFIKNKLHTLFNDWGFYLGHFDDEAVHFAFIEKGKYKSDEYDDEFSAWFKPDVTREEVNEILTKIHRTKNNPCHI